ncbi:hypothetical protein HY990_02120 [Candidatus Micrarchaeota archaeon]|nr:hypothetical protein [Candidatus Micrarchaeota archaeon]
MKVEQKLESLMQYRSELREDDRKVLDRLMSFARDRVRACAKADNLSVLESMLLAMVIEQQKIIEEIQVQTA